MTTQTIRDTEALWSREPEKARSKPTVKARSDGAAVVLEAGGFTWKADLPAPLGGTNQAPSPTALLLGSLAGCAVAFIRDTLAPQLGVRVDAVEATVQCDADARGLLGLAGVRPELHGWRLDVSVLSPDGDDAISRLAAVWRERCPIYLALLRPCDVATSFVRVGG